MRVLFEGNQSISLLFFISDNFYRAGTIMFVMREIKKFDKIMEKCYTIYILIDEYRAFLVSLFIGEISN